MTIRIIGGPAVSVPMLIVLIPALVAAIVFHSAWLLVIVPFVLVGLWLAFCKWGPKKKITPQQFADEVERHLHGTDGEWGWDDTTSIAIEDQRLDVLRLKLVKFDNLGLPERREELTAIVQALRSGEIPDVADD